MKKIVINAGYGGFSLSKEAEREYLERKYPNSIIRYVMPEYRDNSPTNYFTVNGEDFNPYEIPRDDEILVELVESRNAFGWCSDLKVVEIPDDVIWQIEDYDGQEWVAEKHRTWS